MTANWNIRWLWFLGASVLALLIGILTGIAVFADRRAVLRLVEERTASMARLLSAHADAALEDANKIILAIEPLVAGWDLFAPGQGQAIFERLRALLPGSPQIASVWILDEKGISRLDTWSYPSRQIDGSQRPYFLAHAAGEPDPVIRGDVLPGSVSGKDRFTFSRAVRAADGSMKAVIVVGIYRELFEQLYAEAATWSQARVGLFVDGAPYEHSVLARITTLERASPEFVAQLRGVRGTAGPTGTRLIQDGDVTRVVSWRNSEKYPRIFGTASQPIDAALAEWRLRSGLLALGSTLAFIAVCGVAYLGLRLAGERDARAIQTLLARELHHRVKNSLQMVNGLLSMRAAKADSPEVQSALLAGCRQIMAFASIYDLLQNADTFKNVEVGLLIREICTKLSGESILSIDCVCSDELQVDGVQAGNVAVIANELITNATKYAHQHVTVRCDRDESDFYLSVRDDGPGFPKDFSLQTTKRFGLTAAARLSRLMDGELNWSTHPDGGATVAVRLPIARLVRQ